MKLNRGCEIVSERAICPVRVLIAEDDELNQRATSSMLRHLGYQTDVVSNGSEAFAALQSRPYDLVLMNVGMPGMDGLEATRRIRKCLPLQRQPKIIALTAQVLPECREACLRAGMNGFLAKPVRMDDLGRELSSHLQMGD